MTLFRNAIDFAEAHESTWDRDASGKFGVHHKEKPPWNRLYGPIHSRGPVSGVIVQDGMELAAWGEPDRTDLTYSVVKTYLALLAGVAYDRGLISDVNERIGSRLHGIGFDEGNNALVTWQHLLQQTSEWRGTLWGLPDQLDRYSSATFGAPATGTKGDARPLQTPGTYWEYNDIRVNQLALALLHLFKRPLPDVFREAIMHPLGATDQWQWLGYDNSWVRINGQRMQSVTGGSHWGGGMSISARDQARIAHMMLDLGNNTHGTRVISEGWIHQMREPCEIAPHYSYLTWLNTDQKIFPAVSAASYFGIGAGSSIVWVAPERRLVVVVRWLEASHANELFRKILDVVDKT